MVELLRNRLTGYGVLSPTEPLAQLDRRVVLASPDRAQRALAGGLPDPRRPSGPARAELSRSFTGNAISCGNRRRKTGRSPCRSCPERQQRWLGEDRLLVGCAIRPRKSETSPDPLWRLQYATPGARFEDRHVRSEHQQHDQIWDRQNPPYSADRPWEGKAWDEGERAVLVGLPKELGMPDVFRATHPRAPGHTWAPHGREHLGRRLDHIFASEDLEPTRRRHISSWRAPGISDHSPIDVSFEPPDP